MILLANLKVLKAAIEKNDKIYIIHYFAQTPKFSTYLPTVQHMIGSLVTFSMLPYESFDMEMKIKYPSNWNKK